MNKLRPPPPHILRALDEHQRWLRSQGREGKKLYGRGRLDLRGLILDGADLSLAFLTSKSFEGSSLRGAWLIGADLENSSFTNVDLTGACLDIAYLAATNFIGAKYHQTSFEGANIEDAIWIPTDISTYYERCRSKLSNEWTNAQLETHNTENLAFIKERRERMLREGLALWRMKKCEPLDTAKLTPTV